MKKRIILIFGLILVLTGCGTDKKTIENNVISHYEKNIFSYFNANGLQMLQDAGFHYKETIITSEGRVEMYLYFDENSYSIYISGEKLKNYLNGKTINGCTLEDTDATCEIDAEINDGELIIHPTGDSLIDDYLNSKEVLINVLTLNKDYLKQYPLSVGVEYRSRYTEKTMIMDTIGYNNLPNSDPNIAYFNEHGINDVGCLCLDYINNDGTNDEYKMCFAMEVDEHGFTLPGNAVILEFTKGGSNNE